MAFEAFQRRLRPLHVPDSAFDRCRARAPDDFRPKSVSLPEIDVRRVHPLATPDETVRRWWWCPGALRALPRMARVALRALSGPAPGLPGGGRYASWGVARGAADRAARLAGCCSARCNITDRRLKRSIL